MHFKDNFSKQSDIYLKYRPSYPAGLFEYLNSITDEHELAWDCGTGNGQSAVSLTKFYKTVYATDPSEKQIKNAFPHDKIIYKVEKAEEVSLNSNSVDLITIAQALHWFEFDKFYTEANRVLKEGGIIAAWVYGLPVITPQIDKTIYDFHEDVLGEFWLYENRLIDKEYSTIPFPFQELSPPDFKIQKNLSLNELVGLIKSWSALQRYVEKYGYNPVDELEKELQKYWGNAENTKGATWKLILKIGRNIS